MKVNKVLSIFYINHSLFLAQYLPLKIFSMLYIVVIYRYKVEKGSSDDRKLPDEHTYV